MYEICETIYVIYDEDKKAIYYETNREFGRVVKRMKQYKTLNGAIKCLSKLKGNFKICKIALQDINE